MAWYKVGTVKADKGSAVIIGTGTLWADNKQGIGPGQMILIPGTGTLQAYEILKVNSNTSLTLASNYGGASVNKSTYAILSFYVDSYPDFNRRLASQLGYFQNLLEDIQVIMTGTGTVSITAPDGRVVSISSFAKLTSDMALKANTADLGNASKRNVGGSIGTVADGNDWRFNTIDGKSGGLITGSIINEGSNMYLRASDSNGGWPYLINFMAGQGNNLTYARIYQERSGDFTIATATHAVAKYFQFTGSGDLFVSRNIQCTSLVQTSDRDKKDKITTIPNALDKIGAIRGCTYILKESGTPSAGIIAQEIMEVLPEAVGSVFDDVDEYGEEEQEVQKEVTDEKGEISTISETVKVTKLIRKRDESKRTYTVEYSGVIALAVQAIKELSEKVSAMEAYIGPENLAAMRDSTSGKEPTS